MLLLLIIIIIIIVIIINYKNNYYYYHHHHHYHIIIHWVYCLSSVHAAAFVFPSDGRRQVSQSCCNLITSMLTPERLLRPSLTHIRQHPWFKEALEGLYSPRFTGGIPLVPHGPQAPQPDVHVLRTNAHHGGTPHELMKLIATQTEVIAKFESRISALEKQYVFSVPVHIFCIHGVRVNVPSVIVSAYIRCKITCVTIHMCMCICANCGYVCMRMRYGRKCVCFFNL